MRELQVLAPVVLDRATIPEFCRHALAAVEATTAGGRGASFLDRVVVDLGGTTRVDSAGLGALVMVRERAAELKRTVCLKGASEELRFLLVLTRLEDRFEFEPAMA